MVVAASSDSVSDHDRYREASQILHDVAKPMRVLSALSWGPEVRERFLASGGDELPEPTYAEFDPTDALAGVAEARRLLHPGPPGDEWLEDEARAIESTALMLSTIGTAGFHAYSRQLYGVPTQPLRYDPSTPLDLAEHLLEAIADLKDVSLLPRVVRDQTGEEVAGEIRTAVQAHFGEAAPEVLVVDELSANAVASTSRIKVRRDARFTDRDASQLLNHEAFIHVATGLNGRAQTDLPILAIGHPGTTRTQEGLAVWSEYVSGNLDLDRLRRLAHRVLAVQQVCDGADFIDLYRWFAERSPSPEQAFESTRRVFRGAPLTGGAPFTKDCVYLSGFLGVSAFVRACFSAGRADAIGVLFSGKLDLYSVPALAELRSQGLCKPPQFLPPWAQDPSWVLTYLSLSTFMAGIDLETTTAAADAMLDRCPIIPPA